MLGTVLQIRVGFCAKWKQEWNEWRIIELPRQPYNIFYSCTQHNIMLNVPPPHDNVVHHDTELKNFC